MNPVRQALYTRLNGDATLNGLLAAAGSIFHQVAPQNSSAPFVVFHKVSGTPVLQFDGAHIQNDLWSVKGISRGPSATPAEAIANRVDALLDNAILTVTGRAHLYLRRDSDIDYSEQDGGETYHHVGAVYRCHTQPT